VAAYTSRMGIAVQVQLNPGCGHGERTIALVQEVIAALALGASLETVTILDAEEAEQRGFRGSPTVLVDGQDVEPAPLPGVGVG
jgi:hypothetical protein